MEIVKISPSAYVLRDPKTSQNVGCVVTPDGVILVDPGCSDQAAAAIRAKLPEITDQPVAYVILAHAQAEVTGSASFDVPVIAHQACYQAMERVRSQQDRALARGESDSVRASASRAAELPPLPTVSFTEDGYLYVGGVLLELLHAPGRAEGSLAVHLPDEHVLFAGDTVAVDAYAIIQHGSAFRWRETLLRLRALGAAKIVPARGRVAAPEDIDRHIAHLQSIIATADLFEPRDEPSAHLTGGERAVESESAVLLQKIAIER